jgi:hypothetical protein
VRSDAAAADVEHSPMPQLVCVWVPLVHATLHNGCLYVVPRELDAHWANASHPSHLRPALAVDGAPQLTEVRPCARPRTAEPLG